MKRLLKVVALLAWAVGAMAAYPDRPVTIVVPFAADGPSDKVAHDLADVLRRTLGQPVVIENISGVGGTLGAARVAKAAPDGHTLLMHHIGMATSPALHRKLPYDPLADFETVGLVDEVPMTLVGRPGLPAASFGELRKWIAAHKGEIRLGHAGLGAASHLCGLLLQQSLKTAMTTVPYKGTGPALSDLLSGQIDLLCDQTTNTSTAIEDGKVRAYAVTTARRLDTPALARLPTLDESGLKGFNVTIWYGLYAPRGTPPAVIAKLNTALRAALQDPQFIGRQQALGAVIVTDDRRSPAAHRKFVEAELRRWGAVIKAAGQYAD